ncbi:PC-esterase domain-containing protein 1B-like [Dendronephthya gigantea]|uniref:PC-esterase domain-containing protein 1B-like n=1 Tax=Dendronephthya gigantea TaxID=151771 RepID=UPI00106BE463|nr:PC-esterase domain-containing protein 1B-like [Dendronephthya gigantea]
MATHWFSTNDTQKLLENKKVVIIGDSVQRGVYKDLVCLLQKDQLLKPGDLKKKGEDSFEGDELLEGGSKAGLKNVKYKEVRRFAKGATVIMFYFVSRCYGDYVKSIIDTFDNAPPDIVIMNSCLWDLCRYGKNSISEFKENAKELLEALGLVMPFESKKMFIWNASLPVIDSRRASCVPFDFPQDFYPENESVRGANLYVRDQMIDYGNHFVFLDLYNIFHGHLNHRIHDGVHWDDFAHRKITHFLLSEISEQLGFKLPCKENTPPVVPSDPRRTIRPSLPSIPSVGGRRSHGFVPNHSTSPYQRPRPKAAHHVHHPPYRATNPLPYPLLTTMARLSYQGARFLGSNFPLR